MVENVSWGLGNFNCFLASGSIGTPEHSDPVTELNSRWSWYKAAFMRFFTPYYWFLFFYFTNFFLLFISSYAVRIINLQILITRGLVNHKLHIGMLQTYIIQIYQTNNIFNSDMIHLITPFSFYVDIPFFKWNFPNLFRFDSFTNI